MAVKKAGKTTTLVPLERVTQSILVIRGQKVMLDADLAELYATTTKRLNEQVKRNRARFPADFMFPLTNEEKAEVVANCDHLSRLKFSSVLPMAFTEHGAIMAASVLNSARAVEMSVFVVRAFYPATADARLYGLSGYAVLTRPTKLIIRQPKQGGGGQGRGDRQRSRVGRVPPWPINEGHIAGTRAQRNPTRVGTELDFVKQGQSTYLR
jgi:hypothetical protein